MTLGWAPEVPDQARIDAVRVGQVLSNLLNNAVKFTERGEIRIQVSFEKERLAIAVSDTGIGIAEDKQDRLFTPFEQVESDITRRFGGTGLGLAICHQLAQKMGARWCSRASRGTVPGSPSTSRWRRVSGMPRRWQATIGGCLARMRPCRARCSGWGQAASSGSTAGSSR